MVEVAVSQGVCLGFGGTNARMGHYHEGDLLDPDTVETPAEPDQFFGWIALQATKASGMGAKWMVAGFPGPVSPDGSLVGPMVNVPGLAHSEYNLREEIARAGAGELLAGGFHVIAVNDGELAAHAAASRIGEFRYNRVAALILGSGVGAGIVQRDTQERTIYRADRSNPAELGHVVRSAMISDSYENAVSGTAIADRFQTKAENLSADHEIWKEVGPIAGQMATALGLLFGAELVVPTGGVGAGASGKYGPYLEHFMQEYVEFGNETQRKFKPAIGLVDPAEAHYFELYGAEGVMRDFLTRSVAA